MNYKLAVDFNYCNTFDQTGFFRISIVSFCNFKIIVRNIKPLKSPEKVFLVLIYRNIRF